MACVILVCPTQSIVLCLPVGCLSCSLQRKAQVGFVVVLSGLCVATYLPLYTTHIEQMCKENGAFPHGKMQDL